MFRDKGYQERFLERERIKIRGMERDTLLEDKVKWDGNEDISISIVLDYNLQTWDMKNITKYWQVLKQDVHLGGTLLDEPRFVYKRDLNLRDKIVRNVIEPPNSKTHVFWHQGIPYLWPVL